MISKQRGFVAEIIKPIISWIFGSETRIKIFLIILPIATIGATAFYYYEQATALKAENIAAAVQIESLASQLESSQQALADARKRYLLAAERRTELEQVIQDQAKVYNDKVNVFDKERSRFSRLFEKKADLIILRANKATLKTFNDIEVDLNEN